MAIVLVLVALSGWTAALAALGDAGPLGGGGAVVPAAPPTISLPARTTSTPTPRPTLTPAPTPDGPDLIDESETPTPEPEGSDASTPTPPGSLAANGPPPPTPTFTRQPSPTATPSPSATAPPPFVARLVEAGDSLTSIAAAYGANADMVASANRLPPDGGVRVGQTLFIPRVGGIIHAVVEGDSVSAIADLYGVTRSAIVDTNQLGDASLIYVGQRLLVPGARLPTPTANPPTETPTPTLSPTRVPVTQTATRTASPTAAATTGAIATPAPRPTGSGGPNAPLRWPAGGGISQQFGENGHTGVDIMANMGDPVLAAGNGTVVLLVDSDVGYGKRVEVDHGGGMSTLYAHLSVFSVAAGQRVSTGQRLGSVGDTGFAYGPHLHFEVRVSNVPVDPLRYLN